MVVYMVLVVFITAITIVIDISDRAGKIISIFSELFFYLQNEL